MMIAIKVVLGLLAVWFGVGTFIRGFMYLGFIHQNDPEVGFPNIGWKFPLRECIIDFCITIVLITIIIKL